MISAYWAIIATIRRLTSSDSPGQRRIRQARSGSNSPESAAPAAHSAALVSVDLRNPLASQSVMESGSSPATPNRYSFEDPTSFVDLVCFYYIALRNRPDWTAPGVSSYGVAHRETTRSARPHVHWGFAIGRPAAHRSVCGARGRKSIFNCNRACVRDMMKWWCGFAFDESWCQPWHSPPFAAACMIAGASNSGVMN